MIVTEFQPLNPGMFADGLFVVEPATTLEQVHDPDDTRRIVRVSSGAPSGVNTEYEWTYRRADDTDD